MVPLRKFLKKLCALALLPALVFPMGGCTSILQRPYASSVDHVEYTQTEDSSILRAETYRGLVDAILYFVNAHMDQGVVRLYNYTGDVNTDLDTACREILREDPLSAFAVEDITCECSRIVSYYEATITLTYSHTAREVAAIQFVSGAAGIRQELANAMASFAPSLALRVSYFPGTVETVRAMAVQAYYDTPRAAFGMPEFQIAIYPESGVQRIVEVGIRWPDQPSVLAARSTTLLVRARNLLAENPPRGEGYTPVELARLLRDTTAAPDPQGEANPYAALKGRPANQLSRALALELLLQLAGLDATLVTGRVESGDVCWLIVGVEDGWRHLLLTDKTPRLYTDLELIAMGYLWNTDSYPACIDYNADLSGVTPPGGTEDLPFSESGGTVDNTEGSQHQDSRPSDEGDADEDGAGEEDGDMGPGRDGP